MLALAHPVQSHSPHDTPSVVAKSSAASRTKPAVRRTPSTSAAASSTSVASYSSSGSSTASASTLPSASSSRSSLLASHNIRPDPPLPHSSAKHDANLHHSAASSSSSRHASQRQQQSSAQHVTEQRTPPASSSSSKPVQAPPATGNYGSPKDPIDIHTYPSNELLKLLASLLAKIAQANDALSPQATQNAASAAQAIPPAYSPTQEECPIWHTLTTASRQALSTPTSPLSFHARNVPSISLEAYLLRILRYCPTTNEVFLSLLVYFDRMSKLAQEATGQRFAIDSYNVHRLVIAGVTVASKFFSDVFYTNSRYAKVGGLPQAELNQLELQFLLLNDFRLVIPPEEMQRYAEQLIAFSESQSKHVEGDSTTIQVRAPTANASVSVTPQSVHPPHAAAPHSHGAHHSNSGISTGVHTHEEDAANAHRNSTPRHSASAAPPSAFFPEDERDPDSSVCSETDTDAETDDEPTIRANHSCASLETQSVCSTDTNDEDGDADDSEYGFVPARRPPYSRRWTSSDSSVDDGRMHSP